MDLLTPFNLAAGAGGIVALACLYLYSKWYEADYAQREILAPQIIAQANITPQDDPNYKERLQNVLMSTNSDTLQYIVNNNINVGLDRAMAQEDYGFWERSPDAIYYPEKNFISLWDDGDNPSLFTKSTILHGPKNLAKLVSHHQKNNGQFNEPQVGYHYTTMRPVGNTMLPKTNYGVCDFSRALKTEKHRNLAQTPA